MPVVVYYDVPIFNNLPYCHSELKAFLNNHKEGWENKQTEVEAAACSLRKSQKEKGPLPKKKRKRGKKSEPQEQLSNSFANYAAELRIEMFAKVKL